MRSGLLWLIGIPLPIILILWLVTGHAYLSDASVSPPP